MSYLESIILGIVQGAGEFLPISSSAHLVIMPWLLKFKDPGLAFDVALHFGTLLSIIAYFWKDWWQIFSGATAHVRQFIDDRRSPARVKRAESHRPEFNLLLYLVLATIPAVFAGLLLEDWADTSLRHPLLIAVNMVVLGIVLLRVDKKKGNLKTVADITLRMALIIGFAQCLALLPGVSRSGITITAALLLGLRRVDSARFSFLLSTPTIVGACLLKAGYITQLFSDSVALVGLVTSAVIGFLSIKYLLKLVEHFSYAVFCY
ncbi:MAG: hypothetical protein ACD_62C00215G0011, partial [uncultured bacterium]